MLYQDIFHGKLKKKMYFMPRFVVLVKELALLSCRLWAAVRNNVYGSIYEKYHVEGLLLFPPIWSGNRIRISQWFGSFPCLVLTSSPLLFPIACLVVLPVQPPQLVTYNDAGMRPALTVPVNEPNPDPCQLDTRNICPTALSFENPIPIDLAA